MALPGGIHIGRRWSEAIGWKARDDFCYKAYIGLLWCSDKTIPKKRFFLMISFVVGFAMLEGVKCNIRHKFFFDSEVNQSSNGWSDIDT